MQKIINEPQAVVDEMVEGYVKTHSVLVATTDNPRVLKYAHAPVSGKVGIVTGGGSGHKPAFIGYIGRNMVDAVAVGEIFSSPPAQMFFDAFKAADSGKGVACLYGNYAGDNMNVKMAMELAKEEGIEVRTVVANDDVPSAPKDQRAKRRGVAGEILMWKVGGAKAAMGASLDEVVARRRRPSTIPAAWASGSRHAPSRRSDIPTLPSRTEQWRWASAITASRAWRWSSWRPLSR